MDILLLASFYLIIHYFLSARDMISTQWMISELVYTSDMSWKGKQIKRDKWKII